MAITWHWREDNAPLYVSLAGGSLTLSFAGEASVSFDGEGRLLGAFLDHITYRRGLDNRVLAKWTEPDRRWLRRRRLLPGAERRELLARCYNLAHRVEEGLQGGQLLVDKAAETVPIVQQWLDAVSTWDWPRLEAERERFLQVYKPVSILPPDQYLSVVIQATEGCSYNQCTFCTFYRDRRFRIKPLPLLEQHIQAVQAFLGRGLTVRRTLFLADANAVIAPQHWLLPALERINQAFPILPVDAPPEEQHAWKAAHPWHLTGVYSFISAADALHKTPADFADLRARNLRRVYIGLETGHDPLREFLRKQGKAADVRAAVEAIKQGGLQVGLIAMVGVGGDRFQEGHFRDTVALVQSLPLGPEDLFYLSPFVEDPASPYAQQVAEAGIRPLSEEEIRAEEERFRDVLRPWARARGVRISHYDVREFIY